MLQRLRSRILSFLADNYAPFHSMPIECTDRDAAFVLGGLLYNESDLEIEEHYTDTHGRADCTIDPQTVVDHRDKMGQFYASLESGHTIASVAWQRLVSCTAKNHFYRANRDLGRIFKTELLLSYLSEPRLRARIQRGLLKVEQLHALARDIYYGRRGRINARELHEQMNSCSCLTLLLACVVYWQAKEISRVLKMGIPEGEDINLKTQGALISLGYHFLGQGKVVRGSDMDVI